MSYQPEHALHLSVDQLAAHLERRLRGTEREAVVAHLVECDACRREYIATAEIVGAARRKWLVGSGIGLAAAAVLVFAVLPRALPPTETTVARDVPAQRASAPDVPVPIRLGAPADGERITGSNVRLSWHPDGNDALYRITVLTADGAVVWKAETRDTTVTLPTTTPVAAGATYYWIIDALHADGRVARSPASAFIP